MTAEDEPKQPEGSDKDGAKKDAAKTGESAAGAAGRGGRPGAMTMAMKAVQVTPPSGPKVLRIGVLQAGRIIEERIIRKRETVTVGGSERNHFVVLADAIPSRFELFQLVGDDYILNFTEDMTGRVGLPGGVQELDQMRQSGAARQSGDHYQVKLSDTSRGKVVIGPTTLLFQFVEPPPVQPRPQLPAGARAGFVRSIDWVFTAFVVFTFMTMFGFIVYLENADWPIDEGIAAVPDDLARMIFEEPPPPLEPEEAEPTEEEGEAEGEAEESAEPAPTPEPRPGPPGPSTDEGEAAVAEKSARIAEEAAQAAEALIVGALSSEAGGALADVLAGGAVTGSAEDILSQAAGVGVAQSSSGGTLRQRSGGGSGSGQQKGLGALAAAGGKGTTQAKGEGGAVKERKIRGKTSVGSGGDIAGAGDFDASLVVAMIRKRIGAIRACYERELRRNPTLAGKVTVEFTIQPRGNVTGVKVVANTTGDNAVGKCVANAVARFRFNPGPDGGSVTFSYPFVFAPQS
ncbi:MAG: AgmX/PglI C-terminal domain-containing protein [Myxococcales bacterium]|jgi:TonB family protein